MSNLNPGNSYNREVRQESYQDANGNTHVNVTKTTESNDSYQHGYVHGRVAERSTQERASTVRDNENAARGLLLGILLTTIAALSAGVIWYLNQSPQASTSTPQPVLVPVPSDKPNTESSTVDRSSEKQTIIERIKEVPVPVLQPPASTPQQNENMTTPAPTQPETEAETTQPQQNNSATTESQTPSAEGTLGQDTTTSESSSQ
ncbi:MULTISPECIES: hypothetical protein [Chroococcidiopsis]|jgi:hypothetical protein|uniref:Uncharacterized protein n=1 Tax=Chroococcidiopsis thermalis (strain PCC 7203) TaxID=251229 RepID=K9TW73_CHRTP|nr:MULTISPECIES: hypothetical protein [Chroococcidiopsis]AFY87092.1 hypothetical protein Chro_1568 [Chroococcidiopsis thermalis PCC 7203]MBE9016162.1 hypothetical protein [Chroococcidiopsidales cyanobacterium LEGE 13417]PSM48604.1 hypothetical protein C7Y66_13715 [Chroococcidiopsis sp. CCALA 051]URD51952.1 hypothetical protein M5J74_08145 [Chroococcidiopsis sp. CCNUC1]